MPDPSTAPASPPANLPVPLTSFIGREREVDEVKRILATSREPLGSAGETTWRVPSLALPPPSAADEPRLEGVTRYEAVRLFIDRASAARPGFSATDRNAPALAEICRRLDGIPLAI